MHTIIMIIIVKPRETEFIKLRPNVMNGILKYATSMYIISVPVYKLPI